MADPRFFDNRGPVDVARICDITGAKLIAGQAETKIYDVASLDTAGPGQAAYCEGVKFRPQLERTQASAIFVADKFVPLVPKGAVTLLTQQPSLAFAKLSNALYPDAGLIWPQTIPPLQMIAPTARVGQSTVIAPNVFLGENCVIGDDCAIAPGVVIGRGVHIGHKAKIGPGVSISHALIGDRCIIHAGSRIGQDGFGFVGGQFKIPQLGRVIIQDDVEIGATVTIDRGALGDTVIGEGTKIDNLVQIGHNTKVGRRCIIVSQSGASGSCEIGDFVVIGGQVGIADHVKIGQGAYVASRAGVSRSLEGGKVYGGFPARPVEQWRREVGVVARLAKSRKPKEGSDGSKDE